jgi:thiamine pyrophosphate-dependent acetolactate synthase large subunit-like protein
VVDLGGRQSFLTTHPLDLTGAQRDLLDQADFVLALDVTDLAGALTTVDRARRPRTSRLPEGARVVHYTLEGLNVRSLVGDVEALQPEDLRVAADTARAVPALVARCRERVRRSGASEARLAERRARLAEMRRTMRTGWREAAVAARDQRPLSTAATALAVWEAIGAGSRPWLLANGSLNDWTHKLWDFGRPMLHLGRSGGAGLGYGIGAAIGAALAHRDDETLVVDLQADGDLLYAPGALWTAAHHGIPLLMVVWNNRTYYNSEEHATFMARTRERSLENVGVGIHIRRPDVDFALMARSMGVHGEGPVEDYAGLVAALERAVRVVTTERKAALVDVVSQPR